MFERYTEPARRAIFFARYEASQFNCSQLQTEHLLLGLLRGDQAPVTKLLAPQTRIEQLRHSIRDRDNIGPKTPMSVDLPLSHECERVLAYGAEECERLHHKQIGPEHLLLGLLREEKSVAARLLRGQGITLESVRKQVLVS
jgi:ATP-dependent Clp protease ATP-binding subunit ClpC